MILILQLMAAIVSIVILVSLLYGAVASYRNRRRYRSLVRERMRKIGGNK